VLRRGDVSKLAASLAEYRASEQEDPGVLHVPAAGLQQLDGHLNAVDHRLSRDRETPVGPD
jgi:hypothetical protein